MQQVEIVASPALRALFLVVAVIMLMLWGWSLIPAIANRSNPDEDGFSYVPVFYASITCLPIALLLIAGAISGRGRAMARARNTLFIGGGLLFLVAAFLIIQHIANANDGKVFGVQIGSKLETGGGKWDRKTKPLPASAG